VLIMAFSAGSALEPKVQFLEGWNLVDRIGRFKAPASAIDEGTLVKVDTDGETLAVCETNDAMYILEQPVAAVSAIGNATNREKYLNGIPQKSVAYGQEMTVYPLKSGNTLWTKNYATGSETGAITSGNITPGVTQVGAYDGKWGILQPGDTAIGVIQKGMDANDGIEILIY
jgi:hypothetical protein